MAEAPSKGSMGFLGQKVGPLPLGVWLLAAVAIWYYVSKKNAPAPSSATGGTTGTYGTDPAGNTGYINPVTGFVYGTPQDAQAANGTGAVAQNTSGTVNGSGGYTDDSQWGAAAVNFLVGRGDDPTAANQAVTLYLSGQSLTAQQQAMVNSSIQSIGAPPELPGPTDKNPGTIVNPPGTPSPGQTTPPPGSGGTAPPPPPAGGSGGSKKLSAPSVHVTHVTSNSVSAKWNAVSGATSYVVQVTYQSKTYKQVTTKTPTVTITGLRPNSSMHINVTAKGPNGATSAPGSAASFHTSK